MDGGLFKWVFQTPDGEVVLPSHLFGSVETTADEIILSRPRTDVDLSQYLGDDQAVVEGRCVIQMTDDPDRTESDKTPISDPFVVIGPKKDSADPSKKTGYLEPVDSQGKFHYV